MFPPVSYAQRIRRSGHQVSHALLIHSAIFAFYFIAVSLSLHVFEPSGILVSDEGGEIILLTAPEDGHLELEFDLNYWDYIKIAVLSVGFLLTVGEVIPRILSFVFCGVPKDHLGVVEFRGVPTGQILLPGPFVPALGFRVVSFDASLRILRTGDFIVSTRDGLSLELTAFAQVRLEDPLKTDRTAEASDKIAGVIKSEIRATLSAKYSLRAISEIYNFDFEDIRIRANAKLRPMGQGVVAVEISMKNIPQSAADLFDVLDRMKEKYPHASVERLSDIIGAFCGSPGKRHIDKSVIEELDKVIEAILR